MDIRRLRKQYPADAAVVGVIETENLDYRQARGKVLAAFRKEEEKNKFTYSG
ncbi:MAG TPA: hypothetical protein VF903_04705 [Nitrospirota bacterium]